MDLADDLEGWIRDHKLLVAAIAIGLFLAYRRAPQTTTVLVTFSVAGIVLGYLPAKRIVEWLYAPAWTYLVDISPEGDEFALYKLSPDAWERLEVIEGELHPLRARFDAYECEAYDPGANAALGTWRGSCTDIELLEERERISEIRGELEDRAKAGLSIRIKAGQIVRNAVDRIIRDFNVRTEERAIFRGESIEQAVEAAIEPYDLEARREEETGEVIVEGEIEPEGPTENGESEPDESSSSSPDSYRKALHHGR